MNDPNVVPCVYGIHAVEELLTTRINAIDHIYFEKDRKTAALFNLMKICRKERLSYNLVPPEKLDSLAATGKHQGVVAMCSLKPYGTLDELKTALSSASVPLMVVAASVEDPGNLGSIIRSSVGFGVSALLLERKNTAPLNATIAKTSAGMVEHLCIVKPKNLEGLITDFVLEGYSVVGARMHDGVSPESVDFKKPTILILGGEHRGIPPYLEKLCGAFVSIPVVPVVQSLNVSAAGAVLLYECMRQRDFPGSLP